MGSTPIILDRDPGHDDALAILLALARPELRLKVEPDLVGSMRLSLT